MLTGRARFRMGLTTSSAGRSVSGPPAGRAGCPVAAEQANAHASRCVHSASAYGARTSFPIPRTASTKARSTATRARRPDRGRRDPLVSRVHGENSAGRLPVPCVRPGPFGEK